MEGEEKLIGIGFEVGTQILSVVLIPGFHLQTTVLRGGGCVVPRRSAHHVVGVGEGFNLGVLEGEEGKDIQGKRNFDARLERRLIAQGVQRNLRIPFIQVQCAVGTKQPGPAERQGGAEHQIVEVAGVVLMEQSGHEGEHIAQFRPLEIDNRIEE